MTVCIKDYQETKETIPGAVKTLKSHSVICRRSPKFSLDETGGLGWWYGVGSKAWFLYVFFILSIHVIIIFKWKKG